MGRFKWEGMDSSGKKTTGVVNAVNMRDARKLLRQQGVRVKRITPPSILDLDLNEWMIEHGFGKPFGQKELLGFTKKLSIMINAGVPILQSFEVIYGAESNPVLKKAIRQIAADIGEGKTIHEAMSKQNGFSRLYCNLVKAGEAGGILDEILVKISEHMERIEKTKSQIKSAMMYPAVVSLVGVGVVWGMMVFVVPTFVDMLKENNTKIPAITQFVIDTSNFLSSNTIYMVPGAIGGIFAFKQYINTKEGKVVFDKVFLKVPLFGNIVLKGNLSSFSRTLSTLLGSGISLIDALEICIETLDNTVVANDLKKVRKKVVEGKTLTEPLAKIPYFPPMVAQMIKVGEQTGGIDIMLEKVSQVFEDEVNELVGNMTKMIEPFIIVVLGGIISLILVAIYLPMFMQASG